MKQIYMDNHSTTPLDPEVLESMMPFLTTQFGNAHSRSHSFGWEAEKATDHAREQLAELIGATPKEIIFTSGGTESNNLAIKGIAEMYAEQGNHIISCTTEHNAVLDPLRKLERAGTHQVTYLPVDEHGLVDVNALQGAITDRTILISIMLANHEIGTIAPMADIGALAKEHGIILHSDACEAVGKIPIDVQELDVDVLSVSAHKFYGPKGSGAVYVRRKKPRVRLTALFDGGGHERGMRSGSVNVPGVVGLGAAAEKAQALMSEESDRLTKYRDRMIQRITGELEEVYLNGHPTQRLPNNVNLSYAYCEGESILMGLKEFAVASGSACTSSTLEPSYILQAIGVREDLAHTSIRYGLGRFNTSEEVDLAIEHTIDVITKLRAMSPLYEMAKAGIDINAIEWTEH